MLLEEVKTMPKAKGIGANYHLADIDPDLWQDIRIKALQEHTTVRAVLLRLLVAWVTAPTAGKSPKA